MQGHAEYQDSPEIEKVPLFDERSMSSDFESEADSEATLYHTSPLPSSTSWQWIDACIKPFIRVCRIQTWRTRLGRVSFALLPSFVQNRISKDDSRTEKLYPTAYLDGMRGLAALFVFFCHYSYGCFVLTRGYGYVYEDGHVNDYFLQLPFIRLLYSGPPMVCIFFVISGYALSLKPLKLMRSRSWDAMSTTMASSIFRRGMRLFIPTVISTFMVVLLVQYGYYDSTREFAEDETFFRAIKEFHQFRMETFYEQFWDWVWRIFEFIHIWSFDQYGGSTGYDLHLWTIPLEFRASMLLFLLQMGLARVRTWIRWFCLFMFAWFSLRNNRWEMILFVAGMLLAETDLIRIARRNAPSNASSSSSPLPTTSWSEKASQAKKHGSSLKKYTWFLVAFCGLYLMSQPDEESADTPGWQYLATWIPEWFDDKYRFWQSIGSILFVLATNFTPTLQRPFNTDFVQYFGKISYAIYLMHGPVLHTAGYTIMRWSWGITGHATQRQYVSGFALSAVFVVPTTIWAADLFWRFCDAPTVRFAKWVETQCIADEDSKS
jgi:peptidoglycan/LPS O-acetylase OafA/YrhL